MRKALIALGAASAVVMSGGVASATEIHLPHVGRPGCEVNGGTVGVLEPDNTVSYDDFYVNVYFCLPPPS
ncbi:MAG TPA: hypothetical protein VG318_07325 [Actinomycetota bacterium]|nr:hypothetical protein [Actinomycetota bacterium]